MTTAEERMHVRFFYHSVGRVFEEIRRLMLEVPDPLLIAEWRGQLGQGRALTLKWFLRELGRPLLLVRHREESRSVLRVGGELRREEKAA